jgi:plasmid stability protein
MLSLTTFGPGNRDRILMTTLTIRNVDPAVKERLRIRAARHGHSMEAELRVILAASVSDEHDATPNLAEAIRQRFAPFGGVDLPEHPAVELRDPPTFDP